MKIILFRHGEKQRIESTNLDDKTGVGLTELGISQVNKLGQALVKNFPSLKSSQIIYSSPYKRTVQSAEIIKSILEIKEIIIITEFSEFMAYTNYQNSREIRQHIQEMAMQNPNWIPPETKVSLNQTLSNFKLKMIEIYNQNHPDLILIATHGGIVRNFIYSLESKYRPSDELIADAKIHEAGYTVLNFDGQNFTVDQFDVHDHL